MYLSRLQVAVAKSYLGLEEHGAEAVEQLEWSDDLTLNKSTGQNSGGGPPPCAERHLPEPGLEGESSLASDPTSPVSHHRLHRYRYKAGVKSRVLRSELRCCLRIKMK